MSDREDAKLKLLLNSGLTGQIRRHWLLYLTEPGEGKVRREAEKTDPSPEGSLFCVCVCVMGWHCCFFCFFFSYVNTNEVLSVQSKKKMVKIEKTGYSHIPGPFMLVKLEKNGKRQKPKQNSQMNNSANCEFLTNTNIENNGLMSVSKIKRSKIWL